MEPIKCMVIGSGNIGTDLLYKIRRSELLEAVWMVGIDPESEGLARAASMGLKTTPDGLDGAISHVRDDDVRIAFDATSAYVHEDNSRRLTELGVLMIDLTPAAIGPLCVPPVNLNAIGTDVMNVNMISCAGQATIPIVNAISRVQPVDYAEIVASLASKSIGPGTRANLDEFTYTSSDAICAVGGAARGKALAIINPAEPPMIMRNTIRCLTVDAPDERAIENGVAAMIGEVQKYVPGFRLINGPVFDGEQVSVFMEVAGLGDFLPEYAGNLDIMTAAASRSAELFAQQIQDGTRRSTLLEVAR